MRHLKAGELDSPGDVALLTALRAIGGLRENSYGSFYRKSRAFLHFHVHGDELWADLRPDGEWQRLPATTAPDRQALLALVERAL